MGPRRFRCGPSLSGFAAVFAAVAIFGTGCRGANPPPGKESPNESPDKAGKAAGAADLVTLPVGRVLFDSPEEAARAALALIKAGDTDSLSRLAISEVEFREAVYLRLPASRPERNTSAEFLWEMLHQRSRNSLASTMDRYRGRSFELVAVDFVGESTDYGPFQVHREAVLTVRAPDGERGTLRIFGSMLGRAAATRSSASSPTERLSGGGRRRPFSDPGRGVRFRWPRVAPPPPRCRRESGGGGRASPGGTRAQADRRARWPQ